MLKAYSRIQARINSLRTEDGATATEYALIIGLLSLLIIGALVLMVQPISDFIDSEIVDKLGGAGTPTTP
ncbi:Flp family type IVb pilin [Agromyces sp. CCNWLW203]|uniref:Flp family type IVb pilin n=1 Tax=Agromyces sp. CCNWLW203 TaxID=3112842 RepID=UPI002F967291